MNHYSNTKERVRKIPKKTTKKSKTPYKHENKKKQFIDDLHNKRAKCDDFNKKTLKNACDIFAKELYNTKMHFFYELVQNAEDNIYLPDNKEPWLNFEIKTDSILIQNNEIGFSERDIESICDIGASTKEKSENRHNIGEKGIGFKSVFGITDNPMIFSGDYHFEFNAKEELGYIMPTWILNTPEFVDSKVTNIYLPLNETGKKIILDFEEIDPGIILFLKKLKKIEVNNHITGEFFELKKEVKSNILELQTFKNDEIEHKKFFYIKKKYSRPVDLVEKKREKLKTSTLELAFPLDDVTGFESNFKGRVFSFLPISSYDGGTGFPFIIQGDFLLTSNRGEIREENQWNLWLRECLLDIFMEIIKKFKRNKKLRYSFLNVLPDESEIRDNFFKGFGDEIVDALKEFPCIMDIEKKWLKPSEILLADQDIIDIIPNTVLKKYLNYSFMNRKFLENIKKRNLLLEGLNIEKFSLDHLIEVLQHKEWFIKKRNSWYVKLYQFLGEMLEKSEITAKEINSLEIFKLENGEVISKDENYLYLRSKDGEGKIFEGDYKYLDKKIYYNLDIHDSDENINLKHFFEELEIDRVTPEIIVKRNFINLYKSDDWEKKSEEDLLATIRYIKQKWMEIEKETFSELIKHIVIKTTYHDDEEIIYGKPNTLYLPSEYLTNFDLKAILNPSDERDKIFTSDIYIKNLKHEEIEKWRDFFYRLNVNRVYLPSKKEYLVSIHDQKYLDIIRENTRSKINRISEVNYYYDLKFKLKDNQSEFLTYLSKNWNKLEEFSKTIIRYQTRSLKGYIYDHEEIGFYSDWVENLRNQNWISTKRKILLKPTEVYLESKNLRKFTIGEIPILKVGEFPAEITENFDLLDTLGFNYKVTVPFVLNFVRNLKNSHIMNKKHYFDAYYFLNEHFDEFEYEIASFFENGANIFLPNSKKKFFKTDEIVWESQQNLRIYRTFWGIIKNEYQNLREFFVDKLQIPERISLEELCNVLLQISKKEELTKIDKSYVQLVYKKINDEISQNREDLENEDWWSNFAKEAILLINQNAFWTNDNDIFLNDNDEVFKLLKEYDEIGFISVSKNDIPKLRDFIEYFKIKPITSCLDIEILDRGKTKYLPNLTEILLKSIPYIIRFIFHKNISLFQKIKEETLLSEILNLKCYQLDILSLGITLKDVGPEYKEIQKEMKSDYKLLENKIYLTRNYVDLDVLGILLSKEYFEDMTGLEDFISNLLLKIESRYDSMKLERFLSHKKIHKVSNDEREYFSKYFDEPDLEILFDENTDYIEVENEVIYEIDSDFEVFDEDESYYDEEITPDDETKPISDEPSISNEIKIPSSKKGKFQSLNDGIKIRNRYPSRFPIEIQNLGNLPEIENVQATFEEFASQPRKIISLHQFDNEILEKNIESMIYNQGSKNEKIKFPESISNFSSHNSVNLNFSEDRLFNEKIKNQVGIRGEEIVFRKLCESLKDKYSDYEIVTSSDCFLRLEKENEDKIILEWQNPGDSESRKSYDIILFENNCKNYIEVKSTESEKKSSFLISGSEWELAKVKREQYFIYRVYNALSTRPIIVIIQNPYQKWIDGEIFANPIKIRY